MRASIVLLSVVAVAGCKSPDAPGGFGVNVIVRPGTADTTKLATASAVSITVMGDDPDPYTGQVDVLTQIKAGEARFRYIPKKTDTTLSIHLDVLGSDSSPVASGDSGSVVVQPNQAASALIILGGPSTVGDMATPVDLSASQDMNAPQDMTTLPDLTAPKPKGATCNESSECGSAGGCVDGRCCDTTCQGSCSACNLAGREGTCSPVAVGTAPAPNHPVCAATAASTCKLDGMCDGAGSCRNWVVNTSCGNASCNSGTNQSTGTSKCDGNGTCVAGATITCAPFVCRDATQCWTSCTSGGSECSAGNTCTGSSCGLKGKGTACTVGTECSSGFCADKVCCDATCTETCKACNLPSSPGTCTLVPQGQDPRSSCPAASGASATCAPGGCDGAATKCRFLNSSTSCRAATCDTGTDTQTTAASCDGAGSCPPPSSTSCQAYTCGATACLSTCAGQGDCSIGNYCDSTNHCVPKHALGQVCASSTECGTGTFCSPEGICCDGACNGQCESCNASGHCSKVTGTPASPRAACTNEGAAPCGGSCDGTSANCSYPTVSCGAPTCTQCTVPDSCTLQGHGGEYYRLGAPQCSAGSCVKPAREWCGNYICLAPYGTLPASCLTRCTTGNFSSVCIHSTSCTNMMCTP